VFPAPTGGKPIRYGIYDLHRNEGSVSVGLITIRRLSLVWAGEVGI
jgi:hypothetical protein